MRLSPRERAAILAVVRAKDARARVYLYGSRASDESRGGDIDLLVLSERLGLADKVDILVGLKDKLGEQRIDLLIKRSKKAKADPFVIEVMDSAVEL